MSKNIILKKPGESPIKIPIAEKGDTLKQLQDLVEGYIDIVRSDLLQPHGIDMFINDEGLFSGEDGGPMDENILMAHQVLVGPVVFTGTDSEGETIALTFEQEARVLAICAVFDVRQFDDEVLEPYRATEPYVKVTAFNL